MSDTLRDLTPLASIIGLAGFILLLVAVASSGAMFKPGDWYDTLAKPVWTPPDWLFPIAWTLLYLMIAFAGWLVWREVGFTSARLAFAFYFSQLVLNAAWSWLFFGLHRMELALIDVVVMGLLVVANIVAFYAIHPGAAYLLLPYLLWIGYAAALNLAIWLMNR